LIKRPIQSGFFHSRSPWSTADGWVLKSNHKSIYNTVIIQGGFYLLKQVIYGLKAMD